MRISVSNYKKAIAGLSDAKKEILLKMYAYGPFSTL
jgi:hypothetical protein